MTKNFASNSFLRAALNRTINQIMRKSSFFVVFNKNINFSTESVKKTKMYNFLFFTATYSPKNDNKHPSEMKNYHQTFT